MKKDPMVWAVMLMPVLIIGAYKGILHSLVWIQEYQNPLAYFFVSITVMSIGGVLGLRVLDDKDEQLLRFFAITPLRLSGYFLYKSGFSFVMSLVGAALIFQGVSQSMPLAMIFYQGLIGVLCTLGMGRIAKNKVQGMVLFKPLNTLGLLPCIRLLGENRYDIVLGIMPWDLTYQVIVNGQWHVGKYMLYVAVVVGLCIYLAHTTSAE